MFASAETNTIVSIRIFVRLDTIRMLVQLFDYSKWAGLHIIVLFVCHLNACPTGQQIITCLYTCKNTYLS